MQIRRFSAAKKTKVPHGHPGLYAVPVQLPATQIPEEKRETFAQKVNGLPFLVDVPVTVIAMYFEPGAAMEEYYFLPLRGKELYASADLLARYRKYRVVMPFSGLPTVIIWSGRMRKHYRQLSLNSP
jgi:hypothetical protein